MKNSEKFSKFSKKKIDKTFKNLEVLRKILAIIPKEFLEKH